MKAVTAIVPGCFDPFHLGHLELVKLASTLFQSVVIAVADDGLRSSFLWRAETRKKVVERVLADHKLAVRAVKLLSVPLVDFVADYDNPVIVRGGTNVDREMKMARVNARLGVDVRTVIIPCYAHADLSATLIRELIQVKAKLEYLRQLLPSAVTEELVRQGF